METTYVMEVDGAYRIAGTRVSLDSVVVDFLSGLSPESIADNYDTLTLEQVYGAITFYLAHRAEVDAHCSKTVLSLTPSVSKAVLITSLTRTFESPRKLRHHLSRRTHQD